MRRDVQFALALIDKDTERAKFMSRYAYDSQMRWQMHCALLRWRWVPDLGVYFTLIVAEMLHAISEVKFALAVGLVRQWRYPIRAEAVAMLVHTMQFGGRHKERLAEALIAANFIENERKITDTSDDLMLVESSITLLRAIVLHPVGLEGLVRGAKTVLEGLQMRFERELTDVAAFSTVQEPKGVGKQRKESPVRPATATPKIDVKAGPASWSARPASAFARKRAWS
jgi:hypothetical protein